MGKNESLLVSIITPVLNGEQYLESCIKSIMEQTYPNIEHIFVDGGSTDRTLAILESYRLRYPERIRYISGQDNGVGSATRKGFKLAKGEVIGWIDTDDLYEPDAVKTVADFFTAKPDAMFVFGRCNIIDKDGRPIACSIIKDFDLREALNEWSYIMFCATFYRRQLFDSIGYFNDLGNDLDFWIRVYQRFPMHRIDNHLSNWRLHDESISLKKSPQARRMRNERIRQDFFLALKYGGNLLANRPGRYYGIIVLEIIEFFRPVLGFSYPWLGRRFVHSIKAADNMMSKLRRLRYAGYPLLTPVLSFLIRIWDKIYGGLKWMFKI